jgi:hypothetical protein
VVILGQEVKASCLEQSFRVADLMPEARNRPPGSPSDLLPGLPCGATAMPNLLAG